MKIHFDEADPAGIAFSAQLFTKAHHCFEEFIAGIGEDPKAFFLKPEMIYPIRHMEAEYFKPLLPLETYGVEIVVIKLSESSFQLEFQIEDHCRLRSTHVCVEKASMTKSSIPASLRQNLEKFVSQQ